MFNLRNRDFEFRSGDGGSAEGKLIGYATVFNQDTEIRNWEGNFIERMAKGAFKKTLRDRKPVMMFDHGRNITVPIGVYDEIREDEHGLYVEGRLFDNDMVRPVRDAIEGGAITGMSIRMEVVRDEWRDKAGKLVKGDEIYRLLYEPGDRGPLQRTIKEIKCSEAGPVTFPYYEGTSVGIRSADDVSDEERALIVEGYKKSMLKSEPEHGIVGEDGPEVITLRGTEVTLSVEDIQRVYAESWLEAERTYLWLEAERTHQWLEAERAHNQEVERAVKDSIKSPAIDSFKTSEDADSNVTSSGTPKTDAVRQDTSRGDSQEIKPKKKEEVRRVATLAELKERLAVIDVERADLNDEFRDSEMTDDKQKEFDGLTAERAATATKIEKIEARLAEGISAGSSDRGRIDGAPGFIKKDDEADLHDIAALRNSARTWEEAKVKVNDAAKKLAERAKWATTERTEAKDYAVHLLDMDHTGDLSERFVNNSGAVYERAWSKYAAGHNIGGLTFDEQRALQLGSDPDGGFAIPVELDPTVIWTSAGVVNPVRSRATVKTITGKEYQGVTSAGTTVSRSLEGAEFAENTWQIAQPTIRTERVTGYTTFTFEAEAWASIREEIVFALRDAKDREEAESFTNGNGTSPNASGIVSTHIAPNLVTATGTAAFAAGDLYKLKEALDPRYRANAAWMMDEAILHLIRQWATNDGPNLIQHIDGPNPDRLLGFPIYENFNMAGALTTGTKIVQFGDHKNYYIVDRVGMSLEVNAMVLGANRRPTGQRGIAAYWMNNAKWWVPAGAKTLVTG